MTASSNKVRPPESSNENSVYFNEDYLYFGDFVHSPEESDRQADAIWKLLSLVQGSPVLELGCGYGRITNRLAEKGALVTGLDISPILLNKAKAVAAESGMDVEYVLGDMRSLPWRHRFDAAFLWHLTFGYFSDADNERVLRESASSLRKGGRLLIDHLNIFALRSHGAPTCYVAQRNDDLRIDMMSTEVLTGRAHCDRLIVRNGCVRRTHLYFRLYGFAECARMLRSAGFESVEAYGEEGAPFTSNDPRLVIVARK
ncbi:class I SAM-dependent methyltransferase [Mesorhizobium abyssinicae]|uniref:class I SAM-dependent methyltransferase n=1 Tax=Mesorhizobium abyssinicae TaxID=1209958 RepID=UPI002A24B7AA|nr:class I SAM-dependent methyltransferase [Mesorhizobium abyssinicae]MDX8437283.1 class I SAM-dependent methyltransferase [Mesorhizobium abyssinicae]